MTFLQPWVLAALPLVALPLVIHLINQRRFQTVPWAAMMFLLSARAMSRGYSRLRHWLIMLVRMAAVAAVILAVGRPLSRGWLALAGGGRPDTAIVILDRSPSMQQRDPATPESKLDAGRRQLAAALATLAPARTVLVADPAQEPLELADPAALADLPAAAGLATASDIPAALQAAYDYVRDNSAGVTEVWICSDQRANDWAADAGPWASLRDAFARLPQQVRFQLVSFTAAAPANVAVRVGAARLERRGSDRQLLLSIGVTRQDDDAARTLPVTIEIAGATSVVDVEISGREGILKNQVIPLGRAAGPGWGRVSIPADENPADNECYFAFDDPAPRRTIVVAEDSAVRRVLELVAGLPPEREQRAEVEVVAAESLATAGWDEAALLAWQGPLPRDAAAAAVDAFLARGGQALFFPPATPDATEYAGVSWTQWVDHRDAVRAVSWRTEQDLLANTLSGAALPVGDLEIRRACGLAGDFVPLALLAGDAPLVARSAGVPGVALCTTTPAVRDSTLAAEGVVLYALVQRAIDRGLAVLGRARAVDAGPLPGAAGDWRRVGGPAETAAAAPGLEAGVYAAGPRLVAVNRPAAEDAGRVVADDRIDGLFAGLSLARVNGRPGGDGIVQEIWRAFLIALLVALAVEGLLGLPRRAGAPPARSSAPLEAAA